MTEITASSYSTIHRSETLHTHLLCPPSAAEVSYRSTHQRCVYHSSLFLSPRTRSTGAVTVRDGNLSQSQLGSGSKGPIPCSCPFKKDMALDFTNFTNFSIFSPHLPHAAPSTAWGNCTIPAAERPSTRYTPTHTRPLAYVAARPPHEGGG